MCGLYVVCFVLMFVFSLGQDMETGLGPHLLEAGCTCVGLSRSKRLTQLWLSPLCCCFVCRTEAGCFSSCADSAIERAYLKLYHGKFNV